MSGKSLDRLAAARRSGPPLKAAFFDLDGTLVHGTEEIPQIVVEEFDRLRSRGIAVCLATGRGYFSARPIAERLGIVHPSMFYSGSLIIEPHSETVVWADYLPPEATLRFVETVLAQGFYTELYTRTDYFIQAPSHFTPIHLQYMHGREAIVGPLDKAIATEKLFKLVCMVERGPEEQRLRELMLKFPEFSAGISTGSAHPDIFYFNITATTASRDAAFDQFLAHFGIRAEETAAFGDAESDVPFLRRAGYGVAMLNAPESVRNAARFVTGTVEEGGVVEALRIIFP